MKKLLVFMAAACIVAAIGATASASYVVTGETVRVTSGDHRTGSGGPFKLTVQEDLSRFFETFCLEKTEYISLGAIYGVTVDSAAILGGGGAIAGQDPISTGTANLYIAWRAGTLDDVVSGFSYTNAAHNEQVQKVVWTFEDEYTGTLTTLGDAIKSQFEDLSDYTGNSVRVANLWSLDSSGNLQYDASGSLTGHKQSQLTLVPEPASVAVWSVIGLVFGAGFWRRRQSSK